MRSVFIKLVFPGIIFLLLKTSLCAQPYGLDARSPIGAFLDQKLPPSTTIPSGAWTVVNAFPNLTFEDPTSFTPEPRGNRLFVTGRQGQIWSFVNDPNTTTKTLFLDLSAKTQGWDDCGLLGIAFHPQYGQTGSPNRGYVYVYYQFRPENILGSATVRPPAATIGYNRLSRFTVPDGSLTADPNSEQILINQFDRHLWHNGGGIFFGTDGFLYLSNGDEGDAGDSYGNTQRINFGLFSGVLRIDVDRNIGRSHPIRRLTQSATSPPAGWPGNFNGNYYIPNDNPWQDPNGSILEEFWAIGIRSPHRMTFDPVTGQIWLGDVGQDRGEEVDLIEKGGNYQWAYKEGSFIGYKNMPFPLIGTDKPPIHAYPHDQSDGCVIGGYVYRGSRFTADLSGKYIFGDNGSGRIWTLTYNGSSPATVTYLVNMPPGMNYAGGLSSFGIDQNNELYMCTMGSSGRVWKLDRSGSSGATIPALLSQTGVFANISTMATAPGLIPYDVNMPLWSDAAVKHRWIALPNDGAPYTTSEQVAFSPTGEWSFPQGTVFVKHFEIGTDDRNPNIKKRLETRLLVRNNAGAVYGVTYKWRADNSDADLLSGSLSENITIATATGTRIQTWYYPSRQDCLTCHNPNAGHVLGVKTRQLNGNFTYPSTGRTDNQLRTWNHLGMFSPTLNEASIPGYAHLMNVTNTTASLEDRVRSYIDANCAQCHRPNGVQGYFDARYDTPLTNQGIVEGNVANNLGIPGARVVASGDISKSIMHLRMNATDLNKMPPLARNLVDTQAVAVLDAWINTLSPIPGLPSPWEHQDIGNVGQPGDASFASGTFTIQASGDDIWNNADAFHFVYRPLIGDGEIVARVTALQNTDGWAKSGVMIREGLAANARHASMLMTFSQGSSFQRRLTVGGASTDTTLVSPRIPYWVRLVRAGSTLTGYSSSNGVNWVQISSVSIAMSNPVYIGLAVTAHNTTTLNTSTIDNVQLTLPGGTPPTIATQPQSQMVNAGSNVTFTVQATGTAPLNYQWRFNSSNLSGSTTSSLTLLNVQTNNAGSYSVVVTNTSGSITSSIATLTVIPPPNIPPTIATQPQSQTVNAGSNVTFIVQAAGTTPLHYQWRFNSANLSGATTSTLMLLNVQTNNAGPYSVVVTNTSGVVTSSIATLTIIPPPSNPPTIANQPQSQTVNAGNNVAFTVQANGSAPLSYQWRFNSANLSGATTSSLTLLNVQTNNSGNYSVVITNTSGSVTSSIAALTVIPPANTNLPAPWQHQDIGNVAFAGGASFSNSIFAVRGSGDDIWNNADAFHFVYQPLTGNGQVVARVTGIQDTGGGWAKAGVMIRETLTTGSRHVLMLMSTGNGASFQWRTNASGLSSSVTVRGINVPYWVRLTRTGNVFSGYDSVDGTNWVLVGNITIPLSANTYAGLAVTAHDNTVINTSTFDNVLMLQSLGPAPLFVSPRRSSNGLFTVTLQGTAARSYEILGSTNFANWSVLTVLTNSTGQTQFTETNSAGLRFRFYRARLLP